MVEIADVSLASVESPMLLDSPESDFVENSSDLEGSADTATATDGVETIVSIARKHFIAEPQPGLADQFSIFRTAFVAPAGRCGILVQVQLDHPVPDDARLDLRIINLATMQAESALQIELAQCETSDLDELIIESDFPSNSLIEVVGLTNMAPSQIRLRHLKAIRLPDSRPLSLANFRNEEIRFKTTSLKAVFVGTTNVCNANCPHCPTNKKMTAHLDRGIMSMELFEKLIRGLGGIEITDALLFGVFGEPFHDPLLEQRIRLAKQIRPDLNIDIASNGALMDPDRVAAIIDDVRRISIHIEASSPELYDKLMVPLKAATVLPRVDELIRRFGSKITVTTPLHQANLHEVPRLKFRWSHRGTDVNFLPLQTRATDRTFARRLNLGAAGGFWDADLLDILVVDWDGVTLATCDDFLRRQPIGDLSQSSVHEIMNGEARREIFEALRSFQWNRLPSVMDAIVDDVEVTRDFAAVTAERRRWTVHGQQLLVGLDARKTPEGIWLGSANSSHEPAVFGPYLKVPAGRYHASFVGRSEKGANPRLLFEIAAENGTRRYAAIERSGAELVEFSAGMEFVHDRPESALEFRLFPVSGDGSQTVLQQVELIRLAD